MINNKIAIVTHVNPFSSGSGQIQRVYNTLLALAADWDSVTIYTQGEEKTLPDRLASLLVLNPTVEIIYVKSSFYLKYLSPIFHLLFYFGYGKPSNWQLPILFKSIKDDIVAKKYQKIIFEYWYLYELAAKVKTTENLIICDTHDVLSNSYEEQLDKFFWMPIWYKQFLLRRYRQLEFETALQNFDILIAINKKEEDLFSEVFRNKKIYFCPMGVKFSSLEIEPHVQLPVNNFFKIIYYGGLGGAKNTTDAIKVLEALKKIKSSYRDKINYTIIGSNPQKSLLDLADKVANVFVQGFVSDLSLAFNDVDLAVIPFTGKYGFRSRLIELMHYGIPILTTSDAVWGMGFQNNENIFIYEDDNDLPNVIVQLLNDNFTRNRIALNAKNKIDKELTFENTYQKLSQFLLST